MLMMSKIDIAAIEAAQGGVARRLQAPAVFASEPTSGADRASVFLPGSCRSRSTAMEPPP
jgi:hypothetical protein